MYEFKKKGVGVTERLRTYPWLTHGSVDFLERYLRQIPYPRALEFGAGGSTIWLSQRVHRLITVEHLQHWYRCVEEYLRKHATDKNWDLILHPRPYDGICERYPCNYFDLVLVDGRDRLDCIRRARKLVKPGGVLMLDNAELRKYRCDDLLPGWEKTEHKQIGVHPYDGFSLPGWTTTHWVRPEDWEPEGEPDKCASDL